VSFVYVLPPQDPVVTELHQILREWLTVLKNYYRVHFQFMTFSLALFSTVLCLIQIFVCLFVCWIAKSHVRLQRSLQRHHNVGEIQQSIDITYNISSLQLHFSIS
jgi:hypothetical protein